MSDTAFHPDDPLFLISRSLDEELSAADSARLRELLGGDASLAREANRLRSLDRLLKRWAADAPSIDWKDHQAVIQAKTEQSGDEAELHSVDRLLERWAATEVRVDESAFVASVMQRVRLAPKARTRTAPYPLVFRFGLPLAAAAAVAFAVFTGTWNPEGKTTVSFGKRPITRLAIGSPDSAMATVAVSFDRSRPTNDASPVRGQGIDMGAVGVDSWTPTTEDQVPM